MQYVTFCWAFFLLLFVQQGDKVRKLKEEGALELSLKEAVQELKHRKKLLEDKELELTPVDADFDRGKLEGIII